MIIMSSWLIWIKNCKSISAPRTYMDFTLEIHISPHTWSDTIVTFIDVFDYLLAINIC